jgi:putative endonuclease
MPSSESAPHRRNQRQTGRNYEQLAAQFYLDQGFSILAQNWQASHKEIDIVVRKENLIAFVEVKAAESDEFGHPIQKMTRAKRKNLTQAATLYLATFRIADCDIRFDVVTFYKGEMEHFPAAFISEE